MHRLKEWSVAGDFGEEHNAQREMADKFANRGYVKSVGSQPLSPEDEEIVQQLVDERTAAKKERDFGTADDMRDDLGQRFDVTINDKLKMWSVGGRFDESGEKPRGEYVRRGGGELTEEDVARITAMLAERYEAKRNRNFDAADGLRDELMRTYDVRIDDRSGEWRVDTEDYAMAGDNTLSTDDVADVHAQIKRRFVLKREREYEEADAIRDGLRDRYGVKIDDRTKEWLVDSEYAGFYSGAAGDDTTSSSTPYGAGDTGGTPDAETRHGGVGDTAEEAVTDKLDAALESVLNDMDDSVVEVQEEPTNGSSSALTEDDLKALTVPLIKEKLKEAGLPVSGKKADLIARLLA